MAIIVTPQDQIDQYYANPALQQSRLKLLSEPTLAKFNAATMKNQQEVDDFEDNSAFNIGGAVDTWLTSSREAFEAQYHCSKVSKPSDAIMKMINRVFQLLEQESKSIDGDVTETTIANVKASNLEDYPNLILLALDEEKYQPRWKEETRIEAILKHKAYFEDLKEAYGKQILSAEEYEVVEAICESLLTNPKTNKYFNKEVQSKLEHIDFYYQMPIYFKYMGIDCKALLDFCLVFKNPQGEIFRVVPLDLKTTRFAPVSFPIAMRQRRYDIQGAFYTIALEEWLKTQKTAPICDIKPFKFIVESTAKGTQGKPLVFEMTPELLEIGRNGRIPLTTNLFNTPSPIDMQQSLVHSLPLKSRILGVNQLMEIYKYHLYNGFEEEKVIKDNNGKPLPLDWDNDFRELYFE